MNAYQKNRLFIIIEKARKLNAWRPDFAVKFSNSEHDDDTLEFWEQTLNQIEGGNHD